MAQTKIFSKLICLFLFFPLIWSFTVVCEAKELFRIGTGGKTGVYFPVGKLIAQGLTEPLRTKAIPGGKKTGIPGYIAVAQNSAGSVENINTIISNETEAGLIQADVASWAYQSSGPFAGEKKFQTIRAVASLYPEKFQIVTRKDANIHKVTDLRGKRISLDELGSGTLSVMRIILAAHSLSEKDLRPVYLKPVFTENKMISGELQGFVMMAGAPMEAVLKLSDIGISLVPISKKIANKINRQYPYLVPGFIPANVYPNVPETQTIQVHALLAVNSAMDEELVYQVTRTLWSPHMLSLLKRGHPQGKAITLESALTGLSIPLHEGAKRFYREQGLLIKDLLSK